MSDSARELVRALGLTAHPEGGWYRELYRSPLKVEGPHGPRAALTTIYYLLEHPQVSRWHVVSADEVWHFYAAASLELITYDPQTRRVARHVLGAPGEREAPVAVVPAGVWQAARTLGPYSLVGCSVAPGFDFADFRFVASLPGHEAHFSGELAAFHELL